MKDAMPTAYALMMIREARTQDEDLLAGSGIDQKDLEQQDYMRFDQFLFILDRYSAFNDKPDWGFSFGMRLGIASHGPLGFGAISAPTVTDGLSILARYIGARACYASCVMSRQEDAIRLTFAMDPRVSPYRARMCETLSMIFQSYIESTGASTAPTVWHFPFTEPDHVRFYSRWLHGGYAFSSEQFWLEVPWSVGMVVSPFHDELIYRSSILQCESILASMAETPVPETVRNLLAASLELRLTESRPTTPVPDTARIAGEIGVSKRTLIRRLERDGTSFREIRDELLKEMIQRLLQETDASLLDIADRLGYRDAANFTRACKRLYGESPRSLRSRLAGNERSSRIISSAVP